MSQTAGGVGSQTAGSHFAAGLSSITYAPTQVSNIAPFAFMGIGLIFSAVGLLFTIVLLFVFPPVAIVTLLFCVFGIAFMSFGGWRWYSNRQRRLQLNPQTLISFSRANPFQLQLTDICAVSVQEGFYRAKDPLSAIDIQTQHRYWIVRIQNNAGAYLDLDVTQDGYIGTFDVLRILRDLLPRLPPGALIDPRIHDYLGSGRIQ